MRKSQLAIINNILFLYGVLISFFVISTAIFNLDNTYSVVMLALFLPVAVYFLNKIFSGTGHLFHNLLNTGQDKHPHFGGFSLSSFIEQSETSFLVNLVLLCLAVAVLLFRISLNILQ